MLRKMFLWFIITCFTSCAYAAEKSESSIQRLAAWDSIKHVVIVILENQPNSAAMRQPFMSSLVPKGGYTAQLFAITHPSQPNYFALVAGSTFGVDNSTTNRSETHIGDLFDAKGLSWKTYAENYPGNCFLGSSNGKYARRHEPFISFRSVQSNPTQCAKVVPATQFFTDVTAGNLPTYSFYVPNNDNNGHDTGIAFADNWLKNTFGTLLSDTNLLKDTLFIVTFDEDDGDEDNHIYTTFVGAGVKPGARSETHYTLYSILRTIEEIFKLGTLGREDQSAQPILDIWATDSPPPTECLPPANIKSSYTTDKRSITLSWDSPMGSKPVIDFEITDGFDAPKFKGTALTYTDTSLPGTNGKFTYRLYSNCADGRSAPAQVEVDIQDTPPPPKDCVAPGNIKSTWTPDKRSITLSWTQPVNSAEIEDFEVNDWQNRLMWRGDELSFTDNTLPGRNGKFTYFLYTKCTDGMSSPGIQVDVNITDSPTSKCLPPANIGSSYTPDKRSITLTWQAPVNSDPVTEYQVNDWLNRVMWKGNALSFTDNTLPGSNGKFDYFLYSVCSNGVSKGVKKTVKIK